MYRLITIKYQIFLLIFKDYMILKLYGNTKKI